MGILNKIFDNFYRSRRWPEVRKAHIQKEPFCQCCGRTDKLEVHHIEPVHKNPKRELDPDNLITLCGQHCHLVFGHLMDYTSWNDNIRQDAAEYLQKIKTRPYKNEKDTNDNANSFNILFRRLFSRNN
jgi:5-methylcytosine-specific restriction protein A